MKKQNLERPIQMIIRVSEQEREVINKRMALLRTENLSAFVRKMACDGHIIKVDFSEFRAMFADISGIGRNINLIAKRINTTDRVYSEDIAELKERQEEIWKIIKAMCKRIP